MSLPATSKPVVKKQRTRVRLVLILAYLALGVVVFLTGRTHKVIVDYKGSADSSYPALEQVTVFVGKNEGIEYMGGDFRDQVTVRGQRQRLVIEPFSGGDRIVRDFTIPVGKDIVLLSVPKAAAGILPFVEPFVAPERITAPDENANNSNSFTSPGGTPQTMMELPPTEQTADLPIPTP
jgi:hypothetical protein